MTQPGRRVQPGLSPHEAVCCARTNANTGWPYLDDRTSARRFSPVGQPGALDRRQTSRCHTYAHAPSPGCNAREVINSVVPALYARLPHQVVHNEFVLPNVLVSGNRVTGVLDSWCYFSTCSVAGAAVSVAQKWLVDC
ncbi:MAG: phosphotransferase [Chloroflexi bacterium]|nr:phosphotransferase [Chloroflexota bacterium]MBV9899315.1 phosphotransferase [Chloroflexota bacterium]